MAMEGALVAPAAVEAAPAAPSPQRTATTSAPAEVAAPMASRLARRTVPPVCSQKTMTLDIAGSLWISWVSVSEDFGFVLEGFDERGDGGRPFADDAAFLAGGRQRDLDHF